MRAEANADHRQITDGLAGDDLGNGPERRRLDDPATGELDQCWSQRSVGNPVGIRYQHGHLSTELRLRMMRRLRRGQLLRRAQGSLPGDGG